MLLTCFGMQRSRYVFPTLNISLFVSKNFFYLFKLEAEIMLLISHYRFLWNFIS